MKKPREHRELPAGAPATAAHVDVHIPPSHILPQDLVDIHDHGPKANPHKQPIRHRWHVTDAKHAMTVEPDRYKLAPVFRQRELTPEEAARAANAELRG